MHRTDLGEYLVGDSFKIIDSYISKKYKNKIQLILTSPPYPLNSPREYGNLKGREYIEFFVSLGKKFQDLLTDDGSFVIELGNTWEANRPMQSTIHLECGLGLAKSRDNDFNLVQEFICHNPASLPSPTRWAAIKKIRLVDSYSHLWWFSKSDYPKADSKKILRPYSKSMKNLLKNKKMISRKHPSGYKMNKRSILKDNGGALMVNFIDVDKAFDMEELRLPEASMRFSNTDSSSFFYKECKALGIKKVHPARMSMRLAGLFIEFLTDENDIVYDPFGGSNTTGYCSEKLNRKWITSEIKEEYESQSMIRLSEESLNNNLRKIS